MACLNRELYKEDKKNQVINLKSYEEQAKKIVAKFGGSVRIKILKDSQLIGEVVSQLMIGDWRWNEGRNVKKESYRVQCGKWAIQEIRRKMAKNKLVNTDDIAVFNKPVNDNDLTRLENSEFLDKLLSRLSDIQERCIRMHYIEGKDQLEIAQLLSCSRQAVSANLIKGIERLRELTRE